MIKEFHLQIDSGGRMVIPKTIRKELNIHAGAKLVARVSDGEMHITPIKKVIQNARALVNKYCADVDLLEELFRMRREELKQENNLENIRKQDE
jgi:AbrB family looped-hinge helix DNA binding protein